LGVLGVVVASAAARHGAAFRVPTHFAARQLFALVLGALVAIAVVQLGPARVLRAAPIVFAVALLGAFAVFAPRGRVQPSGAHRWLPRAPSSLTPAPLLTAAPAMLLAAWAAAPREGRARRRLLAIGLGGLAVLTFVAQPDFSAAAITAFVMFVALAG